MMQITSIVASYVAPMMGCQSALIGRQLIKESYTPDGYRHLFGTRKGAVAVTAYVGIGVSIFLPMVLNVSPSDVATSLEEEQLYFRIYAALFGLSMGRYSADCEANSKGYVAGGIMCFALSTAWNLMQIFLPELFLNNSR